MHRFFVQGELQEGPLIIMDSAFSHQVRNVLRMKPGEECILFGERPPQVRGWDFLFQIVRITERAVEGKVVNRVKNEREPRLPLFLFQSILKKDNMEFVLAKGTEVGVSVFIPVVSERSIKRGFNDGRVRRIVKEAAEQSGRAVLPSIRTPMPFKDAVSFAKAECVPNVLAHEKEMRRTFDTVPPAAKQVSLFVGPEGGFSEAEVLLARNAGFFVTSLSRRTLRAETAAIVGSYTVLSRFGS